MWKEPQLSDRFVPCREFAIREEYLYHSHTWTINMKLQPDGSVYHVFVLALYSNCMHTHPFPTPHTHTHTHTTLVREGGASAIVLELSSRTGRAKEREGGERVMWA